MPSLPLRSYLESVKDLTLNQLKSILRSHYLEKQGAELYQMLATLSQLPREDPRSFLLRGINIRQKLVLQGSQEDPYNLTYNPEHVQMLFLKSLKTAFQSERITNFMKPHLENLSISDENLILHLNEAISEEEERPAKLAFQKKSKTVGNEVSKANCDEKKGKTDQNPKSVSKSPLLAAVEGLQAQVAEIGGTVKLLDRSAIKKGGQSLLHRHFHQSDHSVDDMRVKILEKVYHSSENPTLLTSLRRTRELFWVNELGTAKPYGFNDQIKGVGTLSSISCKKTNIYSLFNKQSRRKRSHRKRHYNKGLLIQMLL